MPVVRGKRRQLEIDFDPSLLDKYPTAMDALRAAVYTHPHPIKTIAADMDMAASTLSRKVAGDPDDPRRFSLDDLEAFMRASGDRSVLHYLNAKYLPTPEMHEAARLDALEDAMQVMATTLAALKRGRS